MTHTPLPWQINGSHFYGPDPDRKLIGQISESPVVENLQYIVVACNAYPDLVAISKAAEKLLSAFDELQSITRAERIITARSDSELRDTSNEAIAEMRDAVAKVKKS